MFCSNCGNEVDKNSKFCPNCGNRIIKENIIDSAINIVNTMFNDNAHIHSTISDLSKAFYAAEANDELDAEATTQEKIALIDGYHIDKSCDSIRAFVTFALSHVDTNAYRYLTQDKLQIRINNSLMTKAKYAIGLLPPIFSPLRPELDEHFKSVKKQLRRSKRVRRFKIGLIAFGILTAIASIC